MGFEEKYRALKAAVSDLYYAAFWRADRQVDEAELWEAVRDAAGLDVGRSPKELPPMPYEGIRVEFPRAKLRSLATSVLGGMRREFSSEDVDAFLRLYREELESRIHDAVRDYLKKRLKSES